MDCEAWLFPGDLPFETRSTLTLFSLSSLS